MASLALGARQLQNMPEMDFETRFRVQLLSGSLLMGSSIAYPILYQDESRWASVALCTFFLSGTSFNALQIYNILKYGHYTLVVCVVGTILIMSFGHNTITEHAHFIPVYAMWSSFVTAAWPSLEESWTRVRIDGYQVLPTMAETSEHMEVYRAQSWGQPASPASVSSWLRDQSRQRSSPTPFSPPPSLSEGDPRPDQRFTAARLHNIQHMGPASDRSLVRAYTDPSISLGSMPAVPSEISSNALELLGPVDPFRAPRTTQRRHDIDRLGRFITPRDVLSSSA